MTLVLHIAFAMWIRRLSVTPAVTFHVLFSIQIAQVRIHFSWRSAPRPVSCPFWPNASHFAGRKLAQWPKQDTKAFPAYVVLFQHVPLSRISFSTYSRFFASSLAN